MPALHPLPHDAPVSGTGAGRRAAVLFSAHPWQGNPYGLHHIARALAGQGRPVLFVEPPFSPLHLLANRRRGRQFSRSLRQSGVENILLFSPFSLLPYVKLPLLGSKLGLALWPKFALNSFASSVRGTQFERPGVAISGAALFSQFIFALDAEFRGFRLADYDMLFDTVPESLRVQTRSELKRYDAVFASTAILAQAARAAGARQVVSMPNGFEGSGFRGDFVVPNDLARLPSPRIVYVGAMEKWFDWNALTYAAAALPNASFVIIGDSGSEPRPLPRNVHMLGLRPHSKVGAYLRNCDIGIIPFKFDPNPDAMRAIDPIKLWEYLASGLPVIASSQLALPACPGAVEQYSSDTEFAAMLKSMLANGKPAVMPNISDRSWPRIVEAAFHEAGI